jgi:DNA helicase II / ATP-dependent DNA helicase PcrA
MFTPSPQQQAFFTWISEGSGSCVLEAVAGAGKTTTLCESLKLMTPNSSKFFGAYNKQIAEEIGRKAGPVPGLTVSTMHAAGFKYLRRALPQTKLDGDKCRGIYRQRNFERHLEGPVLALVSLAKQSGMDALYPADHDGWMSLVSHYNVEVYDEKRGVDNTNLILDRAASVLLESHHQDPNVIDFDDMIYAPLRRNVKVWEHDWVLIDEAQDTNATRRALALRLLKRGGRLVAVGDRHQAIYGFTGADSNALDLIGQAVNAAALPLTTTYRCPKSVVLVAQQWVSHIEAAPTAPEGEVTNLPVAQLAANARPGDAILCRFNRPLMGLVYEFIAQGVPAKVEGREIGSGLKQLATKWSSNSFDELEQWLDVYTERETAKYRAREHESQAAAVEDKVQCLQVIIERVKARWSTLSDAERAASSVFTNPVGAVCAEVDAIFADNVGKGVVLLSSIHKSKGREWPRVFWLQTGPSAWARKEWEQQQERNLMYVAATRAQAQLTLVSM